MAAFTLHDRTIDRDRLISGLGVAAVHAALGWALLVGLGAHPERIAEVPLAVFNVLKPPVPPPPPPQEKPARAPLKSGRASPPNLKSRATEVAAPKPEIVLPVPPPIVTSPKPAQGDDAASGNSNRVGPGTGSGGFGDGTGSGGWGNGPGGGGGGRPAEPLKTSLGSLDCGNPDSTCSLVEVGMRLWISASGRVTDCQLIKRSIDLQANREACPRAEKKLRFRPATDASGKKIPTSITWLHTFVPTDDGPADPADDG